MRSVHFTASGLGANWATSTRSLAISLPEWAGPLQNVRLATRILGQVATPRDGQFFALGGGTLFRGFDLAQRQGSAMWVGNVELRWPLARNVTWDCLDHCAGARNLWLATFYDVGAIYANGRTVGGNVAHGSDPDLDEGRGD